MITKIHIPLSIGVWVFLYVTITFFPVNPLYFLLFI